MTKREAMKHWQGLSEGRDPLPYMTAIPYKTKGSRYGACGIRIDGNPEFVDAVLSCLKSLLAGEAVHTRLELSRRGVASDFKATPNADDNSEVCYIRLHERGNEGKIAAACYPKIIGL